MSARTLSDGSVINSNTRVINAPDNSSKYKNFGFYKASILRALPKDNPNNRSKKSVEYEAVIISGSRRGEIVRGLRPLDSFGGAGNFNEVVYQPKTQVLKGKNNGDKTIPEDTDGSYVVVGFMGGNYNFPIILGGWPQPNNSEYGASEADGTRILGKFQDLSWNIDKDGVLTISHSGTSIRLNGGSGDVTVTTTAKTVINATGNVEMTSSGNVEMTASGNAEITSTGPATITSSGAVNIGGAAGITFTGPFVKLGSAAAEAVILGDTFKAYFDNHVHGAAGTPPTVPMPASTLSTKSQVE